MNLKNGVKMTEKEKLYISILGKDKIGLEEVLQIDGRMSYSKITKILAKIGDEKAQKINLIPKIFEKNGTKRVFQIKEVVDWMDKPILGLKK